MIWQNTDLSSARCKTDCIDQGKVYCSDDLLTDADVCCNSPIDCARTEYSICSHDASAIGLSYFACPRSVSLCGSEVISLQATNTVNEPQVVQTLPFMQGAGFSSGSMCRYRLEYPFIAAKWDELTVTVKSIQNAVVYVVQANEYNDKEAT